MCSPSGLQEFIAPQRLRKSPLLLLRELTNLSFLCTTGWLLWGNFNSIRWAKEKSTYRRPTRHMDCFNSFINDASLLDIPLTNGLYTWSNFRDPPTLTLIDRFLATKEFLQKFQNVVSKHLHRPTSDYYPIHLSFGLNKWGPSPFRFENVWLQHHSWLPLVQ